MRFFQEVPLPFSLVFPRNHESTSNIFIIFDLEIIISNYYVKCFLKPYAPAVLTPLDFGSFMFQFLVIFPYVDFLSLPNCIYC